MFTAEQKAYLSSITIPIRLACNDASGHPLVVSLWYLFAGDRLFCSTQASARVTQYLQKHPICGFEIASELPPYCGIRGQGIATIDREQGIEILQKLLQRYLGSVDNDLGRRLLARQSPEVAIIIKPTWITSWDFRDRMADTLPGGPDKLCP